VTTINCTTSLRLGSGTQRLWKQNCLSKRISSLVRGAHCRAQPAAVLALEHKDGSLRGHWVGVTCLVPPQLRVRICDENSALAPDTAPLVMPRSGSRAARLPPCYPGGCNSTALRWTEREHGRHGIQVTYLRSRTALITSSASKFRMFSGRMMPASRQRHASRWNVSRNRCAGGRTVGAATSNRPMP